MNEVPLCVVCLQELCNNLTCTPCGHVFHHKCIRKCLESKVSCPLCREKTSNNKLLNISFEINSCKNSSNNDQRIIETLNEKIIILEDKIENQEKSLEIVNKSKDESLEKIKRLQKKYSTCKGVLKNSEFLCEKLLSQYTSTNEALITSTESLNKLENLSKLINDLESSNSIVP